jgi:drug/metabolite transporter (DMT)-like permease
LAVVVVPLLDVLNGKNLLSREIVGIVLAVLGVGILELGGSDGVTAMALSHGDLLSLLQPLAFGMAFWRMEKAMKKYPQQANRSTAAQLLAVFTMSAIYGNYVGFPESSVILNWLQDPHIVMALIWTGCITTALTVYMETIALKTLSAAETTLIFSTEPIWGAACASVVVGEQLGVGSFLGGALILAGCLISNLGMDGIFGKQTKAFQNSFQTTFLPSSLLSLGFASQSTFAVGDIVETDVVAMEEVVEEVIKSVEVAEEVIKSAVENL